VNHFNLVRALLKARIPAALLTIWLGLTASGCRSHGIDITIQNNAPVPIRNLEVDYPGAAFGTPIISPGKSFWYHIKPTSDGDLLITFEPENGKTVRQKGPAVHLSDMGKMILIVYQDQNQEWRMRVQPP
jgi:hypothetical protein